MSSPGTVRGRLAVGDLVIALALGAVFAYALSESVGFTFRAGLVPKVVSSAGLVFVAMQLVSVGYAVLRPAGSAVDEPTETGEPHLADNDYDFATATGREWIATIGWFAGFFVLLWLAGTLVAVPVFAFAYLLAVTRTGLHWAIVYAAAIWLILSFVFAGALELSLPTGVLFVS